jgi:hypothetical protein
MKIHHHEGRAAGVGLIVYGLGTTIAFGALGAPGGDYEAKLVPSYIEQSHWAAAFAIAYVGALSALGLLVFGGAMRRMLPRNGELLWGLSIAGAAISVVGWFVDGGVVVAIAEGGHTVQSGVPHPVVYTVTEIGNLLAVCAPAFFIGVAAIVLAATSNLPTWLRTFSAVAGVCGILAPAYVTLFIFVLWTLVCGGTLARSGEGSLAHAELAGAQVDAA